MNKPASNSVANLTTNSKKFARRIFSIFADFLKIVIEFRFLWNLKYKQTKFLSIFGEFIINFNE